MSDAWMNRGACQGLDVEGFFPERGGDQSGAQAICVTCPVREQCLEYAIENNIIHGVWGGKSARQRIRLRNKRYPRALARNAQPDIAA